MSRTQRTIQKEFSISGVGLHSGESTTLKFLPAPEDTGIKFRRVDLEGQPEIRAGLDSSQERLRRTALVLGEKAEVHTIEHLMACLSMLRIDNVIIEINGLEVPGMDGSGASFLEGLEGCGIQEQSQPRTELVVNTAVGVSDGRDASIFALPYDGFKVTFTLDYQPEIPVQYFSMEIDKDSFRKEIVSARTFCLAQEVTEMEKLGLGKGATYDNTLVVENGKPQKNTCRFENEYVRHKVLDLIGDLALLETDIKGHIVAVKSGHNLNRLFSKKLKHETYWNEIETLLKKPPAFDVRALFRALPHRYPMLMLDKVVHLEFQKRAIGVKNVSFNEEYFQGHFPGQPVMPGVLIVEALAQLGAMLIIRENDPTKIAFLMGMENVKFRHPVEPGDTLVLIADHCKVRSRIGVMEGKAYVNRELVAQAKMKCMIVDTEKKDRA